MEDSKVYGLNACLMCAQFRQDKIQRAFFLKKVSSQFADLTKYLAANKKVYRVVDQEEMEKISQSKHHEGVCFVIEKKPPTPAKAWLLLEKRKRNLVILENVGNPHNVGAIMRICAHFGVNAIAINDAQTAQSGAATRVAEGGAEHIEIIEYDILRDFLIQLKKHDYKILTTSSHGGKDLYSYEMPEKFALLFGEESKGLSETIMKMGDEAIQIPGSGHVESLNVSTAIAIFLGEVYRQKKSKW